MKSKESTWRTDLSNQNLNHNPLKPDKLLKLRQNTRDQIITNLNTPKILNIQCHPIIILNNHIWPKTPSTQVESPLLHIEVLMKYIQHYSIISSKQHNTIKDP